MGTIFRERQSTLIGVNWFARQVFSIFIWSTGCFGKANTRMYWIMCLTSRFFFFNYLIYSFLTLLKNLKKKWCFLTLQTVWLKIRPTGVELIRLIFKFHILYEACYDFFTHAAHVIVSALKLAWHPFRLDVSI